MPNPYNNITFGSLKSQLANSLGDPGMVFFTADELIDSLYESLTIFQAFSHYWREPAKYRPLELNRWIILSDTTTNLVNSSGELALQSQITDRELIADVLRTLLEIVPTDWAGSWNLSDQFSKNDIVQSLNKIYDKFLGETGSLVRVSTLVLSPNQEYFDLDDKVFEVMAVAWVDNVTDPDNPVRYPLYKTGRQDFDFSVGFGELTPGLPNCWSFDSDTLRLRVYPPSEDTGQLEVIVYRLPEDALDPSTTETLLQIPPNLWWVLKYGMLADLLRRDGQAMDWSRAEYCQSRWEDGIKLANLEIPIIINARINNKQIIQSTLLEEDSHNATWAQERGLADRIVNASWDLISAVPIRDTGSDESEVELLLVQQVKLPDSDSVDVQLPNDAVNPIIEYAKHVTLLKTSGAEFGVSIPSYKVMFDYAATYNAMLQKASKSFSFNADKAEDSRNKSLKDSEN